jgi:cysteine desulfurase
MDVTYLDNNATTRLAPEALEAMLPYLTDVYGNPSSVHRFGQRSRKAIDEARGQMASLIGCGESELLFTGGGTEASNTAIRGLYAIRSAASPPRTKIVTSTIEHSATRELCQQLAREGAQLVEVPVDSRGALDLDAFRSALDERAAVATLMWANNETGVLFPVAEIGALCRERGVPFHCDGTQAVGKIAVSVKDARIDAMSLAAHKFHGPKGVGALYLRRGVRLRPLIVGGPQEASRRGGTENVAGIVGMGRAAELAARFLPEMSDRVCVLRDRLEQSVLRDIPDTHVNGRTEPGWRLPNTSNIGFARLEAEAILLLLSERGICASAGAACASGSLEPSHVLRAMGIDQRIAHGAIRFSLSRYSTDGDVDRLMDVLPGAVDRLRSVLPVG